MKKRCLMLTLAVAAALFGGCGEDADIQERDSREESSYGHEESAPNPTVESEEPAEEPLLSSVYAAAKPGNELQFGAYEQDNNLSNGTEPIEWVVLANEGDKIFVMSKYVLVGKMEGGEEIADAPGGVVSWEVSRERKWLNSIFYEGAFSDEEKNCILESNITTQDTEGQDGIGTQSPRPFHTYGGSDTQDFLFLLSYEEFEKYVKPLHIATAEATVASGVKVNSETGYVKWLLRSPGLPNRWGKDSTKTTIDNARDFTEIGSTNGDRYDDVVIQGGTYTLFMSGRAGNAGTGLRVAMWLKVR